MDTEAVFKEVEGKAARMADLLKQLIRVDTSVPPGKNYGVLLDVVEPLLSTAGLSTKRVVVPEERWRRIPLPLEGERANLVASTESGKPPVSIYAHIDVVPAEAGWTVDPFGGIERDGKIIGRGAIDMKGTIPPVIVALETIASLGLEPRFDISVLLCADEEIGIDPGAQYLAEQGYFKPPIIHLEGGGQGPMMAVANGGSLKATVGVTGRSIHAGLGYFGINALEESIPVMEELMRLKAVVEKRESRYPSYPLPGMPSPWMTATFNQTVMRAGEKLNVVPGYAEILVDRRFLPEEALDDVQREILETVDRARPRSKAEISVEFQCIYLPHEIDPDSPHVKRWCDGVRKVLGYETDMPFLFPGTTGSTDMSFVGKELATRDFVGTGVMDAEHLGAHQADESVPIINMVHLCQELLYFLVD